MKLLLSGHNYRYAAEQILLHTFPAEKPEFVTTLPGGGLRARLTLSRGAKITATAVIRRDGEAFTARAAVPDDAALAATARDRLERGLLQRAFFRAAVKSGQTDIPWGAAAGIRPGTLVAKLLAAGMTEREAEAEFRRKYFVSATRAALALDCAKAEVAAAGTLAPESVALYIGIPFCPTRCAYCSFVSNSVEKSLKLLEPFLAALHREIDALAEAVRGTAAKICCVYVGGGTPTTLSAAQLGALLAHVADAFDLAHCREFTVEAGRPDTITAEKLRVMRLRGVDRVSVNPQTFSDAVLAAIGRRHSTEDTLRAFALARDAGFRAVNADLIAGLPADDLSGFRRSLDRAVALAPENITVHALSRKKGSRVTVDEVPTPGGAEVLSMIDGSLTTLRSAGYAPYYLYRQKYSSGGLENTGWTKPGFECLYNIIMMDETGSVLSLGGGGVTKLVARGTRIERAFNPKYPQEYTERIADIIRSKARVREFL
ncbi:MAG: coproporphyrinogen dehydrogenase HemZ, partial [Oscillospiraceae bacterium]|nr:coproporphyrinogen dehydrogenase HemZ [Oscillospiraceae bacterium]